MFVLIGCSSWHIHCIMMLLMMKLWGTCILSKQLMWSLTTYHSPNYINCYSTIECCASYSTRISLWYINSPVTEFMAGFTQTVKASGDIYLAPPDKVMLRWPASNEHPVVVIFGCPVASAPTKMLMSRVILSADAVMEPSSLKMLQLNEIFGKDRLYFTNETA